MIGGACAAFGFAIAALLWGDLLACGMLTVLGTGLAVAS